MLPTAFQMDPQAAAAAAAAAAAHAKAMADYAAQLAAAHQAMAGPPGKPLRPLIMQHISYS